MSIPNPSIIDWEEDEKYFRANDTQPGKEYVKALREAGMIFCHYKKHIVKLTDKFCPFDDKQELTVDICKDCAEEIENEEPEIIVKKSMPEKIDILNILRR